MNRVVKQMLQLHQCFQLVLSTSAFITTSSTLSPFNHLACHILSSISFILLRSIVFVAALNLIFWLLLCDPKQCLLTWSPSSGNHSSLLCHHSTKLQRGWKLLAQNNLLPFDWFVMFVSRFSPVIWCKLRSFPSLMADNSATGLLFTRISFPSMKHSCKNCHSFFDCFDFLISSSHFWFQKPEAYNCLWDERCQLHKKVGHEWWLLQSFWSTCQNVAISFLFFGLHSFQLEEHHHHTHVELKGSNSTNWILPLLLPMHSSHHWSHQTHTSLALIGGTSVSMV